MKQRRYLVIARVGDKSLHNEWIRSDARNFDLFVSYYGKEPEKYKDQVEHYEQQVGPKWPILHDTIRKNWDWIKEYDAVWLPDDDLSADPDTLSRMFKLFDSFDLKLAQPALTRDSYYSYRFVLQQPESVLRYTNFVEVMAPLFSRSALEVLLPTFEQSYSGWGLDLLWPKLKADWGERAFAVLDATAVKHTRPIGGELYKNHSNMKPKEDMRKLAERYAHLQIPLRKPQRYFEVYETIQRRSPRSGLLQRLRSLIA